MSERAHFIGCDLSKSGFLIYEHLDGEEALCCFAKEYNAFSPAALKAPGGTGYCLAVKRG